MLARARAAADKAGMGVLREIDADRPRVDAVAGVGVETALAFAGLTGTGTGIDT